MTFDRFWPRTPMVVKRVSTSGSVLSSASNWRKIWSVRSREDPGGASTITSNSLISSLAMNSAFTDLPTQ